MMSDDPTGSKPVDLKARLGLNKKLANLEATRTDHAAAPAATPKTVGEFQQPPRPKRSFPVETITGVTSPDPTPLAGKSRVLFIGGILVAVILSISAGYVLGTSFQHRRVSNIKIQNAKAAYDIVFHQSVADSNIRELQVTLATLANDLGEDTVAGPLAERTAKTRENVASLISKNVFSLTPAALASAKGYLEALDQVSTDPAALKKLTLAHLADISQGSSKVAVMSAFLKEAQDFAASTLKILQDQKNIADRDKLLLVAHSKFIEKAKLYRQLDVRFPIESIASDSFYFVEIFSTIGVLHSYTVELNALLDAMIQDQNIVDLIGEKRPGTKDDGLYAPHYWIDQNKSTRKTPYVRAQRILSLHQKQMYDRRKKIKGQAIKLAATPEDPVIVPLSEISTVPVGELTQVLADVYVSKIKDRLIVTMAKRLGKINEIYEVLSTESLKRKLEAEMGRTPYFVLF